MYSLPERGGDEAGYEEKVLAEAKRVIAKRFRRGTRIAGIADIQSLAVIELHNLDQEVFAALFLDTRHAIISFEKLFFGTIDHSHVHARIVVQRALEVHAAALILLHNHPSGSPEPSPSDITVTKDLVACLSLFDIRVLDHVIVGGDDTYSLSEHGLM